MNYLGKIYLLICIVLLSQSPAMAIAPYEPTDGEILMMPAGCQFMFKGYNPSGTDWRQRVGAETFAHMHHYCHGLKFIQRAKTTADKAERRQYLSDAISEFNYVLGHWPANSPMMPEAKAKKAEVEAMQKQQ